MPIVIRDFEWKETERTLTIQVALKQVNLTKADICISSRYIKINYEQYFFEVILLHPTDRDLNKCTVTTSHVIFELFKKEKLLWGRLEPDISKNEKQILKQSLIEDEYNLIQTESQEKSNKKHEMKRVAVQQQISLDTVQRNTIEDVRNREKNEALGNVGEWIKETSNVSKQSNKTQPVKVFKNKKRVHVINKSVDHNVEDHQKITRSIPVPLPRATSTLEIDFTPREFPTPCRESLMGEENEWLRKQAEARRSAGFISEDIRPEERNPQFLKAKGDDFMKNGNYLGAISAYSFGIKLSRKYADLYIARSAAQFALGNFHNTAKDCSEALELMKPEVLANLEERALCIGRRGVALCKLEMLHQGIGELQASLKLSANDYFRKELEHFQEMVEQNDEQFD